MRLTYMDRATYRSKASPEVGAASWEEFEDFYLIPEGRNRTRLEFMLLKCCSASSIWSQSASSLGARPSSQW